MARTSKIKQLENQLQAMAGRKTKSSFAGNFGYETSQSVFQQVQQVLRPGLAMRFEIPTRNHPEAYLVQEMVTVCSRLDHALWKLAGDATQDSNGSAQPFCIEVNESLPTQREKILIKANEILRRTKLGLKGKQRIRRALWTGDAIGQPVYTLNGSKWQLTDVVIMPTWEMHYDKRTGVWEQRKADNFVAKPIARWDEVPDYMVRMIHNEDDNQPYGKSHLLTVSVNYRQYIASLEDLYVASRSRAPRRLVHYLGSEDGTWRVSPQALRNYRMRNELGRPRTINTDYYLSKGYEEIDELMGDASGLKALLEVVRSNEDIMLEDLGLPPSARNIGGRNVSDSIDAAYASMINTIRMEDNPFITEVVRRGLLLEGFDDVDLDITIPPVGEAASVREKRVWDAYHNRDISYYSAAAQVGIKNPIAERRQVEEDVKWLDSQDLPTMGTELTKLANVPNMPNGTANGNNSESPRKGGDLQKGKIRRNEQRRTGKKNASGV